MIENAKEIVNVLDKGFVILEGHMGTDLTVVNAARVSFSKESPSLSEKDEALIHYLAKHEHWTPFGHPQVTLHMKMPIFVARQFMRSNVGIVYNEVSRRYVDTPPEFYIPQTWRSRPDKSIKQGSGQGMIEVLNSKKGTEDLWADFDNKGHPSLHVAYGFQAALDMYNDLLNSGVAPEMARMVLPLSTYTEMWATMSLAAAARVCRLREHEHAQWEIQEYARAISSRIEPLFPVSWKALTKAKDATNE